MKHVFPKMFFMFMIMTMSSAADILQNPDFETPPTNITTNVITQPLLLTKANSIPGWSFNGTVWYLVSGTGHAVQLGENGRISQTFKGTDVNLMDYVLTFTLVAQNEDCANNNRTAVNVTAHDRSRLSFDRSYVFFLERNFSRNLWESHAFYLGGWGKGDSVNLEIKSITTFSEQNVSCWPVVDTFTVKKNEMPRWYNGNLLANGDFEVGPAFLKNSSNGILLDQEQDTFYSALQGWSILGTIKYIDSKHYKVPQGKAAIQLLSGDPSGIQIDTIPRVGSYTLNFTIGDANDSCVGYFMVFLQIKNEVLNFTMQSNGTGSAFNHSTTFKVVKSSETSIIFYSFNETRKSDGDICGPVLDNIILRWSGGGRIGLSYGGRIGLGNGGFMFGLFYALLLLM